MINQLMLNRVSSYYIINNRYIAYYIDMLLTIYAINKAHLHIYLNL